MKRTVVAIALAAFAAQVSAATCVAQSKVKKYEAYAKASCEASAKEKNLAGAAQASFVKKCVADAVGS